MKSILSLIFAGILFSNTLNASEYAISRVEFQYGSIGHNPNQLFKKVQLPAAATKFINEHFSSTRVKHTKSKKSPTLDGTFYEVTLANNTEIDFGKDGNWIEVKAAKRKEIPTSFFPTEILNYLKKHYPRIAVESIDKTKSGYELELTNGIELFFDGSAKFLRLKN